MNEAAGEELEPVMPTVQGSDGGQSTVDGRGLGVRGPGWTRAGAGKRVG